VTEFDQFFSQCSLGKNGSNGSTSLWLLAIVSGSHARLYRRYRYGQYDGDKRMRALQIKTVYNRAASSVLAYRFQLQACLEEYSKWKASG